MEKDSVPLQIQGQTQAQAWIFDNRLLNYSEAAEYLSISESYLRRLKAHKQVAFVLVGSRSVRFRVASLDRFIETREMT